MSRKKVVIMGAAGRDFHNFNTVFRDDPSFEVVAFTATQIPNIDGRRYPAALAGPHYPEGIPIHAEAELSGLIARHGVDIVVFSYSDVSHAYVMHKASEVAACGADFWLLGPKRTMIAAKVPVVSVCAVRTGCGKSQTTRRVADILQARGKRVVAVRHPMPYGDLVAQRVQRFATAADLDEAKCTIEEREEYEPHIERGITVYAGVDYGAILERAQAEADVVLWDGGNNDLSFYKPDVEIVVVDPLRAGHELSYHPGETNLRRAHTVVINKMGSADAVSVELLRTNIHMANPGALVVEAASPVSVDDPARIRGKRVLVVEDGPTLTHGEMSWGAGVLAARKFGAAELVDVRAVAKGSLRAVFAKYGHIGPLLPAMGYGAEQVAELRATIEASGAELLLIATPIDLRRLIDPSIPAMRVRYELQEIGRPTLEDALATI